MRRSRDEDCRLPTEPSSFRLVRPSSLARFGSRPLSRPGVSPLVARLPSTRLWRRWAFDPFTAEYELL